MGTETVTPEIVFASILRRAADLIDEGGLYRGEVEDEKTLKRCALTAINDAINTRVPVPLFTAVVDGRSDVFSWFQNEWLRFDSAGDVYRWNDTSDEGVVVDELRAAATELERRDREGIN